MEVNEKDERDKILQEIELLLKKVRELSRNDFEKQCGGVTVYRWWQDADRAVNNLRLSLDPKGRLIVNALNKISEPKS